MIWFLAYIACIFGANAALEHWGVIEVFPGLYATAGVYFVVVALTVRDFLQEAKGRGWAFAAIAVGALLSYLVSPAFAMASAVAFLFSESADFAVYTPLRKRNWLGAVLLSGVVGLLIDSALFLYLAFGRDGFAFFWGQVVAKGYLTVIAVFVLWIVRSRALSLRLRPA